MPTSGITKLYSETPKPVFCIKNLYFFLNTLKRSFKPEIDKTEKVWKPLNYQTAELNQLIKTWRKKK